MTRNSAGWGRINPVSVPPGLVSRLVLIVDQEEEEARFTPSTFLAISKSPNSKPFNLVGGGRCLQNACGCLSACSLCLRWLCLPVRQPRRQPLRLSRQQFPPKQLQPRRPEARPIRFLTSNQESLTSRLFSLARMTTAVGLRLILTA